MAKGPYKATAKPGTVGVAYWVLTDTRTGETCSYPTTERACKAEARYMNRVFAEFDAEASAA